MLTRDEAWNHLCDWTKSDSLRKHARAVEIVMRRAAHRHGAGAVDEEAWGIAGMLHDADYEQWPEDHPRRISGWLRARGEEALAYAVSAHHTKWNVPHRSPLDKALLACDELTGFIIASCLVRPDGVATLTRSIAMRSLRAPRCWGSTFRITSGSSLTRCLGTRRSWASDPAPDPGPRPTAGEPAPPDSTGPRSLARWRRRCVAQSGWWRRRGANPRRPKALTG